MSKKMLINATHLEENRVAIVEDGILSELDIEIAGKEQTRGNIYKGTVVRVESGLQAAFIDYGGERMGFLQLGEIHPSYFKAAEKNSEGKGRLRISDVLRRGQELLLQVVKEERGTKGAALTTFLSLPGRYMVLMPDSDTKGVSRKIEDESQRRKLKEAMASLNLPPDMGYIVRTAGIGQTTEELKRDFDYLVRLYQNIQKMGEESRAPALIYKESNLVIRSIRDYFSADMDEVLVDDPKVFQEARDFFQQVMPEYARLVKLHQERRPIFARYQIEEQIETISKNKVPLPSGGSIVIDQTEALVAVDVNSGKMASEQGVEATAYKTNLEAAAEVGRQLRLRDLGGLIVIDFIDMRDRKHIREVEKSLKDALKNDKARVTVGRISQFGIMEMSRQRIKATLAEGAYLTCPHCFGSGKIKSPEAQAVAFLRKLQAGVAKGNIGLVEGEVPLDVAIYLLNSKREELHEMERQRNLSIFIKGHPGFVAGQTELTFHKREKERMEPEYVSAASAVAVPELEPETEPAAAAEPQEIAEPLEASETTELPEVPAEATGEGKKKRRRRRRRKKGEPETGTPEEGEAAAAGDAEEAASIAESVEEPAPPVAEEAAEAAAPASPEEVRSKPKRRRSRKKKPAAVEPPAGGEAPAAHEVLVSEEAPAASEGHPSPAPEPFPTAEPAVPSAAAEAAEKKPTRRRSRKKAAADAEPQTQAVETAEALLVEQAPVEKGAEKAEPAPAPEASRESKPTRSRKAQAAEPPAKPEEEKAAEESRPAKRKSTVKPKARAKAPESDTEPLLAETDAPSATPSAEKTEKEKSRAPRTTTARTKKRESGESTVEAKPLPDVPEEKNAADDKPKKRAPRKKASPAKKPDEKATTETTEQV
jgi:ribonuclease E